MKNVKQYYRHLGKLVCAVAIADGTVQAEEKEALHEFVLKELVRNEHSTDSSGMNQAFYVDFEFESCVKSPRGLDEMLTSFVKFTETYAEPQDATLLERSIQLIENVAAAYNKKNERRIVNFIRERVTKLTTDLKEKETDRQKPGYLSGLKFKSILC